MERVEQMIEDAVTELEHAAEEHPDLEDVIGSFRDAVEVTNCCCRFLTEKKKLNENFLGHRRCRRYWRPKR